MGFKRKQLREIFVDAGIEVPTDVISQLCELHMQEKDVLMEELNALKDKAKNEPKDTDVKDTDEYKQLQTEYNEYKQNIETERTSTKLNQAKLDALKSAGFNEKVLDLLLKDEALSSVSFDNDKITGLEDAISTLKETRADFLTQTQTAGKVVNNTSKTSNTATVTAEQFKVMGYKQRVELKRKEPELFATLNEQ